MRNAVVEALRSAILAKGIQIHGKDLKVSKELSPQRRTATRSFFSALEVFESKVGDRERYEVRARSLKIYSRPDYELVGAVSAMGCWEWSAGGCRACGVEELAEAAGATPYP